MRKTVPVWLMFHLAPSGKTLVTSWETYLPNRNDVIEHKITNKNWKSTKNITDETVSFKWRSMYPHGVQ